MPVVTVLLIIVIALGAVMFYHASNTKTQELGKVMFETGLLVTLLRVALGMADVIKGIK